MTATEPTYPLRAARTLALHAQGLARLATADPPPTPDDILRAVERVGCVQMDTLQVVQRSHYLTLWSRLGRYNPADLDRLIYDDPSAPPGQNNRRLFEDWLHAACILPLTEYRYRLPHKRRLRENPAPMSEHWLAQLDSVEMLDSVLERIRHEGAVRVSDFEYDGPKRDSWWDWKPVKNALEHLFAWGDLMIADRVNFQRVYDLRERVLPDWVDITEPTWEEMARHVLEQAVRAFGICRPSQAADYIHEIKKEQARPVVEQMLSEGILIPVQIAGRTPAGKSLPGMIVHRDNLPLLEQAADGALTARRTTFLSPFDSLFWPRGRDQQFWGFTQALEAYTPAPKRRWGYFCLPILHHDRLVGRFDPKLERQNGTLRLKALYLEPGVEPDEELVADVAAAMRDFLAFHAAHDLVVERSDPPDFGEKLLAA